MAELMALRPALLGFAQEMERKLRKNDPAKGSNGWQGAAPDHLLTLLGHELRELRRAVSTGPWEKVLEEAADVANMAMMVADADARVERTALTLDVGSERPKAPAEREITSVCLEVRDLLLRKNTAYGNSALEPARIFSRADPIEQLLVRIDDKLTRLQRGQNDDEDTELDLIGYLVLLRVARRRARARRTADGGGEAKSDVLVAQELLHG